MKKKKNDSLLEIVQTKWIKYWEHHMCDKLLVTSTYSVCQPKINRQLFELQFHILCMKCFREWLKWSAKTWTRFKNSFVCMQMDNVS